MVHIWALLSALLCSVVICSEVDVSRELYDLNLPDKQSINVTTIVRNLNTPVGIACGKFKGVEGIFVSSFGQSNIRFVTTNRACEQAGNCPSQWVTGTGTSGITDGDINVILRVWFILKILILWLLPTELMVTYVMLISTPNVLEQ